MRRIVDAVASLVLRVVRFLCPKIEGEERESDDWTFIVCLWAAVFWVLGCVIPLKYIQRAPGNSLVARFARSPAFVELWVLIHLVLSVVAVAVVTQSPTSLIAIYFVLYGIFRTIEIVIVQLNVMLFDQFRKGKKYSIRGYRRSAVLLIQNFAEIVLWFAASYAVLGGFGLLADRPSGLGLIRESFITTVSFGAGAPWVVGWLGHALFTWQGLVGFLITLLSFARFVSLLARPRSRDPDEADPDPPAVVAR